VSRRVRLIVLIAAAFAVVAAGTAIAVSMVLKSVDEAIPQADLFGTPTPSASGAASPTPSPSPSVLPGADIKGPLNILIVGVDSRESIKTWQPHADTVMILHVTKDLKSAYPTSLPRDLVVNIPAFSKAGFPGERSKLTHAMSFGSRVPGSRIPDPKQGFQLLAKTVSGYTGITKWDAGAILTFRGYKKLIDEMGGIDITVDQTVTSIHLNTKGTSLPNNGGTAMTYRPGKKHLNGWQALDYARQRYTPGGDYTRQRHNRQLIKGMLDKIVDLNPWTEPARFAKVVKALGKMLVFDGRGHSVTDFAFALRNLRPSKLTMVGLPGSGVYSGGGYIGEALSSVQKSYFSAVRKDSVGAWVKDHPSLVNKK
jgi:LCP family protein required for cell wall assembly